MSRDVAKAGLVILALHGAIQRFLNARGTVNESDALEQLEHIIHSSWGFMHAQVSALGKELPETGSVPTERRALKVNHNIDGMIKTLRDNPALTVAAVGQFGNATHIVGGTNKGCQHVWDLEAGSCSLCGQDMPGPDSTYSIADEDCSHVYTIGSTVCILCKQPMSIFEQRKRMEGNWEID